MLSAIDTDTHELIDYSYSGRLTSNQSSSIARVLFIEGGNGRLFSSFWSALSFYSAANGFEPNSAVSSRGLRSDRSPMA